MAKNNSFNTLSTLVSDLVLYGSPDSTMGGKLAEWSTKTGPEQFKAQWNHALSACGIRTFADVETKVKPINPVACEIITQFGFVRMPGQDRTGFVHTPACKLMWIIERQDEERPGMMQAFAGGHYGWLRQTMIGVLEQITAVYGVIPTALGEPGVSLVDYIKANLITGADYRALKQTRFTSTGWKAEGPDAKLYWARAKAAYTRVMAEVEAVVPHNALLCECGRSYGVVPSTVEAPAEDVDMSAPDDVINHDVENALVDAEAEFEGLGTRAKNMAIRAKFGALKGEKLTDAVVRYLKV